MLTDAEMRQRLDDALARGYNFCDVQEIVERVRANEWQWHQNRDGVCITSIQENKLGEKYLQGRFIFGDLDAVMEMSDRIDQFGRDHGCIGWIMDGRPGWQKVLKKYGWNFSGIVMTKEL